MSSAMNPRPQYSVKEDLARAVKMILIIFWMSTPVWIIFLRFLPPKFSVQVVGATGLDAPPPHDVLICTAFNITLHAANRRAMDRCYRNGEATVRYSGYTVAWGRTRAFCVGAKEARDVPLVAWADGVRLPPSIRERMAADWSAGAVELEVDMRLFRGDDCSARPTWMSCKATAGGAKPPGVTPCTIFALQNWASDIVPAWMQF
ncbi:hypothetical protein BAE44_0013070 [Dichanthelium oligosanthes]|uniref:Late embryogenesis abundant protein LEA-2 subgroup domain-containing protein n=1 Tax=Dichanthelium oligosanthes TaxID=888268 RepID=A0A1E5VLG7_9POAL|nr:hypothetical protein BAE44_0013070 [Dichanthelium oligosanthes]